jgi:hypothetical protein
MGGGVAAPRKVRITSLHCVMQWTAPKLDPSMRCTRVRFTTWIVPAVSRGGGAPLQHPV